MILCMRLTVVHFMKVTANALVPVQMVHVQLVEHVVLETCPAFGLALSYAAHGMSIGVFQ